MDDGQQNLQPIAPRRQTQMQQCSGLLHFNLSPKTPHCAETPLTHLRGFAFRMGSFFSRSIICLEYSFSSSVESFSAISVNFFGSDAAASTSAAFCHETLLILNRLHCKGRPAFLGVARQKLTVKRSTLSPKQRKAANRNSQALDSRNSSLPRKDPSSHTIRRRFTGCEAAIADPGGPSRRSRVSLPLTKIDG